MEIIVSALQRILVYIINAHDYHFELVPVGIHLQCKSLTALNVLVEGNSYIRRLNEYCLQSGTDNLGLEPGAFNVTF